jgi:hypothetical protein
MGRRVIGTCTAALCLLLLAGCVGGGVRMAGYGELAAWLDAHALPDETVAVQEPGVWARLTAQSVATLPSGGDAGALLDSLQETRPDYCVALRSVAWEGVQVNPWFRERYHPVVWATPAGDSASPLTLYRYRPAPFDGGTAIPLNITLSDPDVGHITVDAVQFSSRRLEPGEPVYVSVTLRGDVREPLRAAWQLRDATSGRVWLRDAKTWPTDAWPVGGTVEERYVIVLPDILSPGEATLELTLSRRNLAPFGDPVALATLYRPPDVTREAPSPDHALDIAAAEGITLAGYDAPERLAPGETLRVALYWHARREVAGDFKVFVHVFGPDGILVAQSDAVPVYWTYPTTAWQPGDTVRDVHVIPLEATLPRGNYRIAAGLYDPVTGLRLPLRNAQGTSLADNAADLYTLRVR